MTTLRATIKGGRLELDVPLDWPDGTEVEIQPVQRGAIKDTTAIMSCPQRVLGQGLGICRAIR
jgi:hypothetical protein